MRRFFAEDLDTSSSHITLSGDEARHISLVLRMRSGDRVLLINGMGEECEAIISNVSDDSVELETTKRRKSSSEPDFDITLFQCLPKQGKMEVIIQKCVELGINRIVPVVSKRCVVRIDGKENKIIRWNKVSQEAAKQCGRAFVPKVEDPHAINSIEFSRFDAVLLAYENEGDNSLKSVLRGFESKPKSIAMIIGPEGGFDADEAEDIIQKGGVSVSLGKRILRTETAGMAMLAQIVYELE